MLDVVLRLSTILLFIIWRIYWWTSEKKADREKPKLREKNTLFARQNIEKYTSWFFYLVVFLQLIGLILFPMKNNEQVFGFVIVVIGFFILISARRELSTNWANAREHQIKQKQTLVTTGVYSYIRHPIYSGLLLCMFGAELVAQSYLFFVCIIGIYAASMQSRREEKIRFATLW